MFIGALIVGPALSVSALISLGWPCQSHFSFLLQLQSLAGYFLWPDKNCDTEIND